MNVLPPVRARRSGLLRLEAPPADVFPLLCPVREVEWAEDWDPKVVFTSSGLVEPGCVFITREEGAEALWSVTLHDPERWRLELVKVLPGVSVTAIEIALEPEGAGSTRAAIVYTVTALGEDGRRAVAAFTDEHYARFMEQWQSQLNHYLRVGGRLDELRHGYE